MQARPPQLSVEDAARFLQEEEETAPRSQFSLDGSRALLQSMRRTSGSNYYDDSFLQDPKDVLLRHVAPNEYSQVNADGLLPDGNGPSLTLGDFLGGNPDDYGSRAKNPAGMAGYNADISGVSRTWSGGVQARADPNQGTRWF